MSEIIIKKVKVIKAGQKLEVKFKQDGKLKSSNDIIGDNQCHSDLLNAVQALAVHMAILSGILPKKLSGDLLELEKYVVTGYSIGGQDDDPGIVITGYRKGEYGTITINTPFIRFEQSDENKYPLIEDLLNKVDKIEVEVDEYVFKAKKAPEAQQQIDFDAIPGEGKTTIKVLGPEKSKSPFKDKADQDVDVPLPKKKAAIKAANKK